MLKLLLAHANVFIRKKHCKRVLIGSGGSSSLKIVFILLAEVVAFYIKFIIIYIWNLDLKRLLVLC